MKLSFTNKNIDAAPKGYVRVRITEKEQKRAVIEDGVEILEIGVGKWDKVNRRKFIRLCRSVIQSAKQHKYKRIAVEFDHSPFPQMKSVALPELASLMAENFEMANFEFRTFKTKPKEGWSDVEEVLICGNTPVGMKKGFERGQIVGKGVNACRELSNTPGGDMTPKHLAAAAKAAAKSAGVGAKLKVKILGKKEMQKLGMGAVLGVAKGSSEEPQFIIMEYKGGNANEKPIVLVGKGVTFDTGGLNIKTGDYMLEMHLDMSGGAAVIWSLILAAKLKLKKNVVALVPAVENMPSGSSYRPGDVLKSLSGKTIEVLNTDAEGRVILADALTYAKRFNPRLVVDVATLTGAALAALGVHANAIMTRDAELETLFRELGEASGDYVWPLPLWDEYEEGVKGNFGDVSNIPTQNSRYAGSINGGMFLYQFVKEGPGSGQAYPWVHIDMAPRMTSASGDELAKGAAGEPVRLLIKLIEQY